MESAVTSDVPLKACLHQTEFSAKGRYIKEKNSSADMQYLSHPLLEHTDALSCKLYYLKVKVSQTRRLRFYAVFIKRDHLNAEWPTQAPSRRLMKQEYYSPFKKGRHCI